MQKLKLKKNNFAGKLIVFEGTDGAGKTTLIEQTKNFIQAKQRDMEVVCLKQPTDLSRKTKLFQRMMYSQNHSDIDYRAVQLLTMSDRIQQSYDTIRPALKEGKIVICDRYIYTSLANMLARGYKSESWFFEVAKHIIKPDIAFLVYIAPPVAIKRIKSRPEESGRYFDELLLYRAAEEFIKMSRSEGLNVIDSTNAPEATFLEIKTILQLKGIV